MSPTRARSTAIGTLPAIQNNVLSTLGLHPMVERDDLLKPSLSDTTAQPIAPIYSATAGYLTSFMGGPLAAIAISSANSWRLNRLNRDLPVYLLCLVLTGALLYWEGRMGGHQWLTTSFGASAPRLTFRLAGIAMFGAAYLLHWSAYRNMQMLGIPAPNGWPIGIACTLAGAFGYNAILAALRG
jgi:hypothetical protein